MTRTELDVQQALEHRADRSADVHDVLARLERSLGATRDAPRRRLVLPLAAAAAAAVVAAALVGMWAGGGSGHRTDTGGSAVSPDSTVATNPAFFAYSFRAGAPSGLAVESRTVEVSRQTIVYSSTRAAAAIAGVPDVVEAVVHARGSFNAATVRTGTPVAVNGVSGFYGPAPAHVRDASGLDRTATVPVVAWQYAPDSWVVVNGVTTAYRNRTAELSVARTVRPVAGGDVRIPFRIGYVPRDLRTATVTTDAISGEVDLDRGAATRVLTIEAIAVQHQSLRALFGTDRAPLTVGGHPAKYEQLREGSKVQGGLITVLRDGFVLSVGGDLTVTAAELRTVAAQVVVAPAGSTAGTWFTTRSALPH